MSRYICRWPHTWQCSDRAERCPTRWTSLNYKNTSHQTTGPTTRPCKQITLIEFGHPDGVNCVAEHYTDFLKINVKRYKIKFFIFKKSDLIRKSYLCVSGSALIYSFLYQQILLATIANMCQEIQMLDKKSFATHWATRLSYNQHADYYQTGSNLYINWTAIGRVDGDRYST